MTRSRLVDNWPVKAAALCLAVVVWFHFAVDEEAVVEYSAVSLRLQNIPMYLESVGEHPTMVSVQVEGPVSTLRQLSEQDIDLRADLSRLGPGLHQVPVDASSARLPFGTRIVKIVPTMLPIELEETLQKVVPVRPRFVGHLPEGYHMVNWELRPSAVMVIGPKSRLQEVAELYTDPVFLDGRRDSVESDIGVTVPNPDVRLDPASRQVTLHLRVEEEKISRTFSSLPVRAALAGQAGLDEELSARFHPETVSAAVEGPRSVVKALSEESLWASVDLSEADAGEHELSPVLQGEPAPPIEKLQVAFSPESVRVLVSP
jgi:YbbR domain-containing protein